MEGEAGSLRSGGGHRIRTHPGTRTLSQRRAGGRRDRLPGRRLHFRPPLEPFEDARGVRAHGRARWSGDIAAHLSRRQSLSRRATCRTFCSSVEHAHRHKLVRFFLSGLVLDGSKIERIREVVHTELPTARRHPRPSVICAPSTSLFIPSIIAVRAQPLQRTLVIREILGAEDENARDAVSVKGSGYPRTTRVGGVIWVRKPHS